MKIGVICEGPTDFHAIKLFMEPALAAAEIEATIFDIHPEMDRTGPEGGWAKVEAWLKRNPPPARVSRYFDGGMFGTLSAKACDVLIIQMDADILDEPGFRTFMNRTYEFAVPDADDPEQRGAAIYEILTLWSAVNALTETDRRRHIFAPAVESTEAWCVAAYDRRHTEPERLRDRKLVQAFMTVLEESENHPPKGNYSIADKDVTRRERFCRRHAVGHTRVAELCPHFNPAVAAIAEADPGL